MPTYGWQNTLANIIRCTKCSFSIPTLLSICVKFVLYLSLHCEKNKNKNIKRPGLGRLKKELKMMWSSGEIFQRFWKNKNVHYLFWGSADGVMKFYCYFWTDKKRSRKKCEYVSNEIFSWNETFWIWRYGGHKNLKRWNMKLHFERRQKRRNFVGNVFAEKISSFIKKGKPEKTATQNFPGMKPA